MAIQIYRQVGANRNGVHIVRPYLARKMFPSTGEVRFSPLEWRHARR
jgi:hypothetical protein